MVNKLKYTKKIHNKKLTTALAFSLIELSIVLIIIGLLVAGVTGGASLIESAKIRNIANEIRGYKQTLYIFYAENDRLPGDLNRDSYIGYASGEVYTADSFGSPYDGKTYPIPNDTYGPTVELYMRGFINFKPTGNTLLSGGMPYSAFPLHSYFETMDYEKDKYYAHHDGLYGVLLTSIFDSSVRGSNDTNGIMKQLDQKLDDGIFNTGNFRGRCYNGKIAYDYDTAKELGIVCDLFYYDLDFKF